MYACKCIILYHSYVILMFKFIYIFICMYIYTYTYIYKHFMFMIKSPIYIVLFKLFCFMHFHKRK